MYENQASQQLKVVDSTSRRSIIKLIGVLCLTFASVSVWAIQRGNMLGALQHSEASLRRSQEQIQLLLDLTAEAIFGIDLEGLCTFSNVAGARFLGYSRPSDLLQQNMHALIHHSKADGTPFPQEECGIYQALRQGQQTHSFERTDLLRIVREVLDSEPVNSGRS